MPRATLIVNPAAGRAPLFRRQAPALTALLVHHGYTADIQETTAAPHSAAQLAASASQGSTLVIACGGDGTVHGVLQGLVSSDATLGVLPLGTANALARNLRLPLDPLQALTRLLAYTPQRIPLGRIEVGSESRRFILMAGCGPDGALAALLASSSRSKARFGRATYYAPRAPPARHAPLAGLSGRVPPARRFGPAHRRSRGPAGLARPRSRRPVRAPHPRARASPPLTCARTCSEPLPPSPSPPGLPTPTPACPTPGSTPLTQPKSAVPRSIRDPSWCRPTPNRSEFYPSP